ncbi:MAG: hypothetical protein IPP58_01925 [Holophagaceae bacterium]|uniref:Transcription-repair-coupling factor C-terminal domain-containing protein n=1 Tax=Candidatus Geothrix skivensis TaxID=2954439 RepID=A0A9D7SEJ9_9BACT|nr:hypothetical protein [Candidatus Geothrix skivensis]
MARQPGPGARLSRRWIPTRPAAARCPTSASRASTGDADLELYKLDLEDRFGRISEDDPETIRFFELLKVKLKAQALGVSEVKAVDKGQLKLRLSPQTPVDPAKLMAWVGQTKGASLSPDGAVRLPVLGTADGPILQAQRVLGLGQGWLVHHPCRCFPPA